MFSNERFSKKEIDCIKQQNAVYDTRNDIRWKGIEPYLSIYEYMNISSQCPPGCPFADDVFTVVSHVSTSMVDGAHQWTTTPSLGAFFTGFPVRI